MCDSTPDAPRRDARVAVLANEAAAPGFWRMRLACPEAAERFAPGQFFQLHIDPDRREPLLRRPFAPSRVEADAITFVYAVVGKGTEGMTRLVPGDGVGLLYPLGHGFALPNDPAMRCVLVGGGCGAPSLLFLAERLRARGHEVDIALGAKSSCALLESEAMHTAATRLFICTDDGSEGLRGTVLGGVEKALADGGAAELFACGPEPMLRALADFAARRGLRCQVSLEARMACGFGACVGCVTPVRDGAGMTYRKVCKDGPVFDASTLLWKA